METLWPSGFLGLHGLVNLPLRDGHYSPLRASSLSPFPKVVSPLCFHLLVLCSGVQPLLFYALGVLTPLIIYQPTLGDVLESLPLPGGLVPTNSKKWEGVRLIQPRWYFDFIWLFGPSPCMVFRR